MWLTLRVAEATKIPAEGAKARRKANSLSVTISQTRTENEGRKEINSSSLMEKERTHTYVTIVYFDNCLLSLSLVLLFGYA